MCWLKLAQSIANFPEDNYGILGELSVRVRSFAVAAGVKLALTATMPFSTLPKLPMYCRLT